MQDLLQNPITVTCESAIGAVIVALVIHWVALTALRLAGGQDGLRGIAGSFALRCWWPLRVLAVAIGLDIAFSAAPMQESIQDPVRHLLALVIIAGVAWLIVRVLEIVADTLAGRLNLQAKDNRRARRIHTQVDVFRRIASIVVIVVALAVILTTFSALRVLGASILASAGIAGIVIGFAAQSSLSNLIAGIQIALTDSVRLDDVVIVENEWGHIEEITFTYVVVKTWDSRRLVLPISYFTKTPFQNWTRSSAWLLGTVYLHVDYRAPVDELRGELQRIVQGSELWDGQVAIIQVTDTSTTDMELRVLVSSEDASKGWDLRCIVREGLVKFLQAHHPETLPRARAELYTQDGNGRAGRAQVLQMDSRG